MDTISLRPKYFQMPRMLPAPEESDDTSRFPRVFVWDDDERSLHGLVVPRFDDGGDDLGNCSLGSVCKAIVLESRCLTEQWVSNEDDEDDDECDDNIYEDMVDDPNYCKTASRTSSSATITSSGSFVMDGYVSSEYESGDEGSSSNNGSAGDKNRFFYT